MSLSLLEICQEALEGIGIDPPSAITAGGDLGNRLLGLANASGQAMATRHDWQALRTEGTFTTTASQEEQANLTTDFPNARKFLDETFWNRTQQRRIFRLSPQAWARIKSDGVSPSSLVYIVRGNRVLFPSDTVVGGETIAFEYIDKRWCSNAAGTTFYRRWSGDTDIPRLDDHLFVLDIRWRFLQSKGLEYGEQFREFQDYLHQKIGEDEPRETLSLNPNVRSEGYDTQIPDGNWNI